MTRLLIRVILALVALATVFHGCLYAQGCGGYACDPDCLPLGTGLSVEITDIDENYVTFCFSVSGRGLDGPRNARFVTEVRAVGYPSVFGSCKVDRHVWLPECEECDSSFSKTIGIPSSGYIEFFTISTQINDENTGVCVCTTATITVPIQPPDTSEQFPNPDELGPSPCETQAGDPVNITNGNMYHEETDALIHFDRGLPLEFARSYNSFADFTGSLGYNWRHSFEYALSVDTVTGDVTLSEATGREFTFSCLEYGGVVDYVPPYGIHYRLEHDTVTGSYDVATQDDIRYAFDSVGTLNYMEDRNGNQLALIYNQDGYVSQIVNHKGVVLSLRYYLDGKLQHVVAPPADTLATYDYYANGDLERVTYGDSSWVEYTYDDRSAREHLMTRIANSDGVTRDFEYDEYGRASAAYGLGGTERVDVSYQTIHNCCPKGFRAAVKGIGVDDSTIYYSYWGPDRRRRFVKEIANPNCSGCGVEYEYDAGGNKTLIVYENGVQDEFEYDLRGNMTSAIRAANTSLARETHWEYHDDINLPTLEYSPSVANPSSEDSTVYQYDGSGNLMKTIRIGWIDTIQQFQDSTLYGYNSCGQVEWIDGPRTDVADSAWFVYYASGDLHYMIAANGDTTEYGERDVLGNRPWVTDVNDVTTEYGYDERGRLIEVVQRPRRPDERTTAYTYGFSGEVKSITFPEGDSIRYNYDERGWLTSIVNSVGDSISYEYDSLSNRIAEEIYDSNGTLHKAETYQYTLENLVHRIINPDSSYSEFTYDEMGKYTALRDANGHYTYYTYDQLGRLDSIIQLDGADSIITRFSYDDDDNLIGLIDPDGNVYSYSYRDDGLLVLDSSSITGVTTYYYDEAGNLIDEVNHQGDTTSYEYDEMNRLTDIHYADSNQDVSYTYDNAAPYYYGLGRLHQELTPACTTTYKYDPFGFVLTESNAIGGTDYSTEYRYNKNGAIKRMTHPSEVMVHYFYDAAGRVNQVKWEKVRPAETLADSIRYIPFGGQHSWIFGNGISPRTAYNMRYLVDSIDTGADHVVSLKYTYDLVGNILQIDDLVDTTKSRGFGYDDLNRLTSATSLSYPSGEIEFDYFDNGNRKTRADDSGTSTYHYSANRLDSITGYAASIFRYDSLGNITYDSSAAGVFSFEYDYGGRLVTAISIDTTAYQYDARVRRTRKIAEHEQPTFLYDKFGRLIEEFDGTGDWQASYVYLNGRPLAKIVPDIAQTPSKGVGGEPPGGGGGQVPMEEVFFYHLDHLGTPLAMTRENKFICWSSEYLPFGQVFNEEGTETNEMRFPGQYHDRETDRYYNWHRYYDPGTGRYLTPDPYHAVQLQGESEPCASPQIPRVSEEINKFQYARNNPIIRVDRLGLKDEECENSNRRWRECLQAQPLSSSSPECDEYDKKKYMGTSLRCFCKCAGDSPWSKMVRGCLRCMDERGVATLKAHIECYRASDKAGLIRPDLRLTYCYILCLYEDDY